MSVTLRVKQKHFIASSQNLLDGPDWRIKQEVPSLTLRTQCSAIPLVWGTWGVHVSGRPPRSLTARLSSPELSEYTSLGITLGPRKCCKAKRLSEPVLEGTGTAANLLVAQSWITTAYFSSFLLLLRMFFSEIMTWSAVIKSAKFSGSFQHAKVSPVLRFLFCFFWILHSEQTPRLLTAFVWI